MKDRIKIEDFKHLGIIERTLKVDYHYPIAYDYYLNDEVRFSIITGSHYDSARLGTVEVALMYREHFVFGDEDNDPEDEIREIFGGKKGSDASIIHYLDFDDFTTMMAFYQLLNTKRAMSIIEIAQLFLTFYYRAENN